jgi:hypothetical protein
MAVGFSNTNKPLNPRGQDASPKGYNRASLFSGKALDFDGVNDTITGSSSSLPASGYTIAAWFNLDTLKASGVFTWGDEATSERRSLFVWDGGSGSYYLYSSTYGSNVRGNTTLSVGRWYFGAVTLTTEGEATIYLNGNQDGVGTNTLAAYTGTTYKIGDTGSSETFDGEISGARVFNTALTAAQVADLYNNPEKVVPTGVDNTALKLWLPMMEGAGTTAYDGSGNGNHGTISGATYVNGIGAPSPQSAVMDWNKAENRFSNSENFDGSSGWVFTNVTRVSENNEDPRGTNTAVEISWAANTPSTYFYRGVDATNSPSTIYLKVWAKSATGTNQNFRLFANNVSHFSNDFVATNEWQQFEFSYAYSNTFWGVLPSSANDAANILVAFPHTAADDSPYLTTLTTAQPNKVLLPQGLTTGRDITGVNLFENVRKQGALNLDGNSWAEVHDNESLDLTTAVTLEAWVYWTGSNSTKGILGRWFSGVASYMLYASTSTQLLFFINTSNSPVNISGTGWKHIVGTYDSTNRRVYIDGQEIGSGTGYTSPIAVGDKPIEIGRYAGNTAYQYDGDIAQPRIYNRALTAAEVLQNYNSGKNTYTND